MPTDVYELHGQRILDLPTEGPLLRTGQDANDLIGEAKSAEASLVVVPIARLDPAFFELRTGIAGEMVQKFVTYQVGRNCRRHQSTRVRKQISTRLHPRIESARLGLVPCRQRRTACKTGHGQP